MYQNPRQKAAALEESIEVDDKEAQSQFDEFYEDVFSELANFGELEEMHVTGNLGDHLTGNLYAKFRREEDAALALGKLNGRFYAGRPILGEFSPVTDFREARCRQFDEGECGRGGYCNFIHPVRPSRSLVRDLFRRQRPGSRSRSRSPRRSRSRSRSPRRRNDRDRRDSRDDRRRDHRDDRGGRDRDRESRGGGGGGDRGGDRGERRRDDRDRDYRGDDRDRRDGRDHRDRDGGRDPRDGGRERERDGGGNEAWDGNPNVMPPSNGNPIVQ